MTETGAIAPSSGHSGASVQVLLVQSDQGEADRVEQELQAALAEPVICRVESQDDYLSRLTDFGPDLIVAEIELPAWNGLSALQLARVLAPGVPFIVLTAAGHEALAEDATRAGATDYVLKSNLRRLAAAAQRSLADRDARKTLQATQEALRRCEQRQQAAQYLGKTGHWEFDLQTQALCWSPSVYSIYGRSPELGPPSAEEEALYYAPEEAQKLRECAQNTLATGRPYELEVSVASPDGRTVALLAMGSLVTSAEGQPVALLGTVQDITAKKAAEARITHLNAVLRAVRSINRLIVRERNPSRLVQQACNLLVGNRGFAQAWIGLSGGSHGSALWAQAGAAEASPRPMGAPLPTTGQRCLEEVLAQEGNLPLVPPRARCGACCVCQCHGLGRAVVAPLQYDGRTWGLLGVAFASEPRADDEELALLGEVADDLAFALNDIALQEQRDRYAQVVTSSRAAVALIGPDHVYLEANRSYTELVREAPQALLGHPIGSLPGEPPFLRALGPQLSQSFAGEETRFEVCHTTEDGQTQYYEATLIPCVGSDVAVSATAVCLRDVTERCCAEAQQRETESKFRLLTENAGLGIGYYSLDGTLLFFNSRAAEYLGGPALSFVGKSVFELFDSALASLILERIRRVALAPEPLQFDDEVRLGPESSWFLSTYTAIRDVTGLVIGVQIISNEWTHRKRAESALQVERDNLKALLTAAPAAILLLNAEERVVHANAAAEELLAQPLERVVGRACGDLLGCAHYRAVAGGCGAASARCAECGLARTLGETRASGRVAKDREVAIELGGDGGAGECLRQRWLVASAGPLTLNDGSGFVLAFHEVTERRRTEETLRFQALLLEAQNEASIDGILIADEAGRILWANRRFGELWQLPPDSVLPGLDGVTLRSLLQTQIGADQDPLGSGPVSCHQNGKSRDELRLKDGRIFERYSAPLVDPTPVPLGRVWLFRDVTFEKRLQASVAQSDRLASMGMLAAGVAHEINNPLSYILYNLESLTEDFSRHAEQLKGAHGSLVTLLGSATLGPLLGSRLEAFWPSTLDDFVARLNEALGGARRIKDIARGLSSFSRVEKERVSAIELRGAIESAISIAYNEIKYRAQLVKDYGTHARVFASDGRLSQVFLNLLVNAAHSIPDGDVEHHRISVRTWEQGNEVFAEVRDTGCGIPEEHLARIFDPFFTTKPAGVGTGLGLHIVRSILVGYGGSIDVISEINQGTRFLVRLPKASLGDGSDSLVPSSLPDLGGPRGRILVIDDDLGIRRTLARMLKGHEVVLAESGERALQILREDTQFDVILCDMMMPQITGSDVHLWLNQHNPLLVKRLVFMTGGAFTASAQLYLDGVDNPKLEKPIDARSLQKRVREWILARRNSLAEG